MRATVALSAQGARPCVIGRQFERSLSDARLRSSQEQQKCPETRHLVRRDPRRAAADQDPTAGIKRSIRDVEGKGLHGRVSQKSQPLNPIPAFFEEFND